jgi:hypothetical protein
MADRPIPNPLGEQTELEFDAFIKYDQDFPQIWRSFKNYTFRTIDKGFENYSARAIFHIIRWQTGINAEFPKGFKVNNNYSPYYARKFMRMFPKYEGFFRNRKSKYDDKS